MNCTPKSLYDIKIKFIDENNGEIYPVSIIGDITKVNCGNGKKIEWDVLKDKSELKGKIRAIVEISKKYSTKVKGGPSNAFLSMLLPGLGEWGVMKEKSVFPLYVTGAFLGSLYFAFSTKIESNKFYDQYRQATTQFEMDTYYKNANDKYQTYQFFLGLAGTIWLGDVIYVTVKGFKNRREQLSGYSQIIKGVNIYFAGTPASFKMGLVKKF